MKLRKRTNAYWQKRSTERVALLERQSEPYIRKVNLIYADAQRDMVQQMKSVYSGNYFNGIIDEFRLHHASQDNGFFLTEYNNQNSPPTFYSLSEADTNSPLKRFTGSAWTDVQPYVIT